MTLRTLTRLKSNINLAHRRVTVALRESMDPNVALAAADSKQAIERALTILDAEIAEKRGRFPSRNQAAAR